MTNEPNEKTTPPPSEVANKQSIPNKLLEFQKRVAAIPKDATNPFFHSKYFNVNTVIEVIKPILNEIGLVVTQGFDYKMDQNVLVTRVMDGNTCLAISEMMIPAQPDVQKLGAAITYCRRYSLVSLLLLQGEEDDDANSVAPQKPNSAPSKAIAPKAVSEASKGLAITPKQKTMINSLLLQKGLKNLSEAGITKIENPTVADGSAIIKKLMDFKPEDNVIQVEPPELFNSEPYVPNHEGD